MKSGDKEGLIDKIVAIIENTRNIRRTRERFGLGFDISCEKTIQGKFPKIQYLTNTQEETRRKFFKKQVEEESKEKKKYPAIAGIPYSITDLRNESAKIEKDILDDYNG